MLNSFDGKTLPMAVRRLAAKVVVSAEAMRSCPAGGSLAKDSHGVDPAQAMWSGWDSAMEDVWPGVSIS